MKMNIKISIIGSTIAAMVAFCGTAQAQPYSSLVSGWAITAYGSGGWSVTEGSPGDFTIGGSSTLTAGAGWGAEFTPINIAGGNYVELTGAFTINNYVGGTGPFRFGLFNDLGSLTGSDSWTGYLFSPATDGAAPGGNGGTGANEFTGRVDSGYASTYGSAYAFGVSSTNSASIANDTYNFDLKLTQMSATLVRMDYSIVGVTNGYTESGFAIDSAGAATANTTYNAAGFYLANNGTAATQLAFTGVTITSSVPEPASVALLGCGLLGLFLVRRSRLMVRRSRVK